MAQYTSVQIENIFSALNNLKKKKHTHTQPVYWNEDGIKVIRGKYVRTIRVSVGRVDVAGDKDVLTEMTRSYHRNHQRHH